MRLLILLLSFALPVAAAAQAPTATAQATPRSVSDCERIQNALAYNECLASFGPRVGERRARVRIGGAVEERGVRRRGRRGGAYARGRGGRKAASFEVRGGRAGATVRATAAGRGKRASRRRR